jgi:hypothetical protein
VGVEVGEDVGGVRGGDAEPDRELVGVDGLAVFVPVRRGDGAGVGQQQVREPRIRRNRSRNLGG